jgi:hypothetical protein
MLVFIDESGDPGFKVDQGASPIFVVAMVIFRSAADAQSTEEKIERSEARRIHKPEFKFNKCSGDVRDRFFLAVRDCSFKVRAIVVRKERIHSPRLRADKERFYEYFVNMMMKYDNSVLRDAKVVIDGSGDRTFRQDLHAAMRRKLGAGVIKDVRFRNSCSDLLVQLADMCAGAIARSCRQDRRDAGRWRQMKAAGRRRMGVSVRMRPRGLLPAEPGTRTVR